MKKTRERKKGTQMQREKMAMNKYLSTITLKVNGLDAPSKRHRVGWGGGEGWGEKAYTVIE